MIQRFDAFVSGITSCYKFIQRIKSMEMTESVALLLYRIHLTTKKIQKGPCGTPQGPNLIRRKYESG